jgi:YD repeat-containing protein
MTMRHTFLMLTAILVAAPAGAHITITPKTAPIKASQEYVVRVPTEKDVPTLSVRMAFPEGFDVLRFRAAPGWKFEVERNAAGKMTGVTWSGRKISREEYEQFSFLARAQTPGLYKLDAYQTYDGGEVVGWVNPAEPRPAPQVTIVAAATGEGDAAPAAADPFAASATTAAPAGATVPPAAAEPSQTGLWLGGSSLVIALAALVASLRKRA